MNKLHHATKSATRARSAIPAASVRQALLEHDDLDDAAEAPWLTLPGDEEDWPEVETDPSDVESELNLLLGSGAHR